MRSVVNCVLVVALAVAVKGASIEPGDLMHNHALNHHALSGEHLYSLTTLGGWELGCHRALVSPTKAVLEFQSKPYPKIWKNRSNCQSETISDNPPPFI